MEAFGIKSETSLGTTSFDNTLRSAVAKRYAHLLADEAASPDKVFISGTSLQSLDPNLVVLDEEAHEHPRVSSL